jgi:hypothetical protein
MKFSYYRVKPGKSRPAGFEADQRAVGDGADAVCGRSIERTAAQKSRIPTTRFLLKNLGV